MSKPMAIVRPLSRFRYLIKPTEGHAVYVVANEVVVVDTHGTETTRLKIEPPGPHMEVSFISGEDRSIEVIYHEGVSSPIWPERPRT